MTDETPEPNPGGAQFAPLELIDLPELVEEISDEWHHRTLAAVNDSVIRLGVVLGESDWYRLEDADEFFYLVDGELAIDVEGEGSIELEPAQGVTIPRGVRRRPRAPAAAVLLKVERAGAAADARPDAPT